MSPDIALLDDDTRPVAVPVGPLTSTQRAAGEQLVLIHDIYRAQLHAVCQVRDQLKAGLTEVGQLHEEISAMTLRSNYERFGAFCVQYCHLVSVHHSIEDQHMLPALLARDGGLGEVIDRLRAEHAVIHRILVQLDTASVTMTGDATTFNKVDRLVDLLKQVLLSHLGYEESELVDPLGFHGVIV